MFLFDFFGTIQIRRIHRAGALRYLGDPNSRLDRYLFSWRAGLQAYLTRFRFCRLSRHHCRQVSINCLQFHFFIGKSNRLCPASCFASCFAARVPQPPPHCHPACSTPPLSPPLRRLKSAGWQGGRKQTNLPRLPHARLRWRDLIHSNSSG